MGTWYTSAEFDNVKVISNKTGRTLGSDKFSLPLNFWWNWEDVIDSGDFNIENGKLVQGETWMPYVETGKVAYFGNDEWTDYTYTVENNVYTIAFATPTDEITLTAAAQVRANSITAYGAAPSDCEHDYVGVETQAPTCAAEGMMTYTCSKCQES